MKEYKRLYNKQIPRVIEKTLTTSRAYCVAITKNFSYYDSSKVKKNLYK